MPKGLKLQTYGTSINCAQTGNKQMKTLKIGIIGLGRFGFSHAENIASKMKGVQLYAACGGDKGRLEKNQQLLDIPVITMDYDEMADFVDCIRTGRNAAVTAEDGIKSVKWALKATEAVLEKKLVKL